MQRPLVRRVALAGSAILWIAFLVFVSINRRGPRTPHGSLTHWAAHVLAFAIPGLMLLPLCRNTGQKWAAALALVCLAGLLELRQHQIFGQPVEWWDIRDDGIGILLASFLLRFNRCRSASPGH
jgi:hypothetical protein